MYVTKVLTDVNEDDVRYLTSTSSSSLNGRKQNGDFESGSTNLKSVHGIGNNAINAIDLECQEHSLTKNSGGENVLSVEKRITIKREREREREETVTIDYSIQLEKREGNENFHEKEKMIERDTNRESEKKKKKEGDKENESRSESKNESKNEGESKSKSGSESEKKGVEVKNKAAHESTATVRLSLGLTHTIQPVSMPTDSLTD